MIFDQFMKMYMHINISIHISCIYLTNGSGISDRLKKKEKMTIIRKPFIASCKKKLLKCNTLSGGQTENVWGSA